MAPSVSRVTAQNQISIPSSARRRFGIGPGTELVWEERDGELVVRPKKYEVEHLRALCAEEPIEKQSLAQLRAARDRAIGEKIARR